MKLKAIADEHTLDLDLLNGGWVLDVGARGFEFAKEILSLGCKVLSLDPSRTVKDPEIEGIVFCNNALSHWDAPGVFHDWGNGTGSHLAGDRPLISGSEVYKVECYSLETLMKRHCIKRFDAIKLDCEGVEYDILERLPGPVATQISGAFHDFINPSESPARHKRILSHISKWYQTIQHEASVRHGHTPPCHWDSLFVLK
jgi:FkbM family methyltransferase